MNKLLMIGAATLALTACTQTQSGYDSTRMDPTGTYYESDAPAQGVGSNMRNSTAGATADRQSTRYPVGSSNSDSNPY